MILCLGTTPALQRVMVFRELRRDEVNRALRTLDGVAGKSLNVVKVLAALGEKPLATGFLGSGRGEEVQSALAARGIESELLRVEPPVRQCITLLDDASGDVTELVEESQPVPTRAYDALLEAVRRRLPGCRALVLSGSLTPGGPVDFYRRCISLASCLDALTVLDAQGGPLIEGLKGGPGLAKPNRAELGVTVGRVLDGEEEVLEAMKELHAQGAQRVVVTAGKEPTLAYDGSAAWRILAPAIRAVNPIGSGDAFTAGLVSGLLRGSDLGEACRLGVAAGAANALTCMPGELERSDFDRLLPAVKVERV